MDAAPKGRCDALTGGGKQRSDKRMRFPGGNHCLFPAGSGSYMRGKTDNGASQTRG